MNGLRRILPFLRSYRWAMIGMILTTILPVTMELVTPRMLQYIIDAGIMPGDFGAIGRGSLIMLAAAILGALATIYQGVCRAQISQGLAFDMRNSLFTHIQSFAFADLDRMQTGQLMTRLSSDVDVVRMFASAGVALLLRAALMIIGSVALMMITDLQLSLIAFGMLIMAAIVVRTILRLTAPLFQEVQQRLGALNTLVQENLAGIQVVKAFVREPYAIERYKERNADFMAQNIRVGYLMVTVMPMLTVITNLGLVGVIWWGGFDAIGGRLTVGELVAFVNYLMIGMAPLLLLSNILTMISRANVSASRVIEVLDTESSIRVPATPHSTTEVRGHVVFENVSFVYGSDEVMLGSSSAPSTNGAGATLPAPQQQDAQTQQDVSQNGRAGQANSADKLDATALNEASESDTAHGAGNGTGNGTGKQAVLDAVSFEVQPGQRIAILGATGAGKSSLVHLVPRFYDVTDGRILIDGADVREWDLHTLRSQIGVVLQQNTLFSGTVRENIAYGRPSATQAEIEAAARLAQAEEFISTLPEGYDSIVEARGANFSGGQKQRISIARALLMQPSILILDDCTSAVDIDTEFKILEALNTVMERCTTFLVAQRINSVLDADQILILDAGKIVARGNHQELLASSPIYQEIYNSQLDVEEMTSLLETGSGRE